MTKLEELTKKICQFRDDRDWKQFHKTKDMLISLALESSELLELAQWKTDDEIDKDKQSIAAELADVAYWLLLISHDLEIDLPKAIEDKLAVNAEKYPVEKSKGNKNKYDKL